MDNNDFHKSEETRQLIKQAVCELLFLPPYSSDLNLIEKVWANIKALIRKLCIDLPQIDYNGSRPLTVRYNQWCDGFVCRQYKVV